MIEPAHAASPGLRAVLEDRTRDVTTTEAESLVLSHYGLVAKAEPVRGERDQNFVMTEEHGPRWVFKLGHAAESEAEALFATRALRHVAALDPDLPVARVLPTAAGRDCFRWTGAGGESRIGRVTSFLPGAPLAGVPRTMIQTERFGVLAARLARALRGFADPEAGRPLPWDLRHALQVADLLASIDHTGDRDRAAAAIERFRSRVLPRLPGLRGQVIHNDLNPSNILVDPDSPDHPCGIIDFGDLVSGALVCDVAIAAAYLATPAEDALAHVVRFVAAYHRFLPLETAEIDLLPDLIATRQAMSLAIGAWRARRDDGNATYLLRNRGAASVGLEAIAASGSADLARRLRGACYPG